MARTSRLSDLLRTLLPCLAGASQQCCAAVVAAVGPEGASAELPDCMCNPDAFDVMARLLDDGGENVFPRALSFHPFREKEIKNK